MINRSLIVVRAKQPFADWLHALPEPAKIALDEINSDSTAYLLQDCESDDERQEVLGRCYDLILEDQFAGWWTDESDWPEIRDLETFKEWFDVEFHSVVRDLPDEPLVDEE